MTVTVLVSFITGICIFNNYYKISLLFTVIHLHHSAIIIINNNNCKTLI